MRELTPENAADYLRARGWIGGGSPVSVRELSGGVSNVVLRVDAAGRDPFVIKQCRERLRVAVEWRARLDRIWVEHAVLLLFGELLPDGVAPRVLFEDRDQYLFAMTFAPESSETWKARLMRGEADREVAARLGAYLAIIHVEGPEHPALAPRLADASLFEELRIDPYYRTAASARPEVADRLGALIADMERPPERRALVLGDFSPKNILVHDDGLVLLDFECAHLGDPGFDIGFFLSHLALKGIHGVLSATDRRELTDAFLQAYEAGVGRPLGPPAESSERAIRHTAACLLARVDGKSPVEYLDEVGRERARRSALTLFEQRPQDWAGLHRVLDEVAAGRP